MDNIFSPFDKDINNGGSYSYYGTPGSGGIINVDEIVNPSGLSENNKDRFDDKDYYSNDKMSWIFFHSN